VFCLLSPRGWAAVEWVKEKAGDRGTVSCVDHVGFGWLAIAEINGVDPARVEFRTASRRDAFC
jgi:hypothetical protein